MKYAEKKTNEAKRGYIHVHEGVRTTHLINVCPEAKPRPKTFIPGRDRSFELDDAVDGIRQPVYRLGPRGTYRLAFYVRYTMGRGCSKKSYTSR